MQEHQPPQEQPEERIGPWDAPPRDGPAVLVINSEILDEEGRLSGRWIDPTAGRDQVRKDIADASNAHPDDPREWAVVDQIGLGPQMLPEHLSVGALMRFARLLREVER